jgi:RNA 2',3'-cyclic 3'-phosphodiesterase
MRLFVALDIDDDIRGHIARFLEGVSGFVPEARWVQAESLHVTLKFIGEKNEERADQIKQSLAMIRADSFDLNIRGYGFFPNTRAPRVFWIGLEAGQKLGALAAMVDENLASLGIPKEEHAFNAHITLARAGASNSRGKRGSKSRENGFQRLQQKLTALPIPDFGAMTTREFFLYQSRLSPVGSKYTKLARFALSSS